VTALRARRADTRGVVVSRVSPTTQKTRIIAHHQQVVRLDRESGAGPDGAGARHVRDFVLRHRARYDVLVVSDYGKGAIGPDLLGALAEASGRAPFTWVLDPKRVNFAHYRRASLVKPNREEAAAASGVEIRDAGTLREAGSRLLERWEAGAVLISRGEEGMALFKPGAHGVVVEEFPTVAREVFDVKVAVPREYAAWETEIREGVRKTAQRGRVEVTVLRTPIPGKRRYRVTVQPALARAYVDAARKLVRTLRLGGSPSLGDVLRLPGLFEVSEAPPDLGRERAALRRALGAALRAFDAERRREGAHLERDMRRRTTQLRALTARIRRRLPQALAALRRQVED